MSKKRTSDESCQGAADEQTNRPNCAAPDVPHDEDNAKRVKLTSYISDTTLQDLPFELIESILIKVIVMEVKSMKLAKSVWKEKAELVINRLADVGSQWSNVLSTDGFRTRLHRALEDHGTIRLEILQQCTIQFYVSSMTALRDEVCLLCKPYRQDHYISIYDRNNMEAEAKYVIALPGLNAQKIVACTVSNCVYILDRKKYRHFSIMRISGDSVPRWSTVSVVIEDTNLPGCWPSFCVTGNGSLVLSRKQTSRIPAISVYDAAGSLQQTIRLPSDITGFNELIPKANGNLVFRGSHRSYNDEDDDDDDDSDDDNDDDDSDDNDDDDSDDDNDDNDEDDNDDDDSDDNDDNDDDDNDDDDSDDDNDDNDEDDSDEDDDDDYDSDWRATLTEIDMNGTKIIQHLSSLVAMTNLGRRSSIVGSHGRMMVVSHAKGMQLFDSELNLMDFTGPQQTGPGQSMFTFPTFHYNSERNETIAVCGNFYTRRTDLTIFRWDEL